MSIRRGYEIEDIEKVMYTLLNALTSSAPWSSWTVIKGWPEDTIFEQEAKPLIYVLEPFLTGIIPQQGGQSGTTWDMIIGCWDSRKTGGPEEINIMGSQILYFFRDPKLSHYTTKITVTLGATTYTSKTLLDMGLMATGIYGPRMIGTQDIKEFRSEFNLSLRS